MRAKRNGASSRPGTAARFALWTVLGSLFLLAAVFGAASPPRSADLTVSAAISLTESLQTIRNVYRRRAPGVSVILNLGASGILEQQIEQGAPVDIFISASPLEMDQLQRKGLLINSTRRNLLRNTLVLICPASTHLVSGFSDLAGASVKRVVMANPESVPAGRYARQALEYFGVYKLVRPKIILTEDVRQALAYVETGNVDAGLVYLTEARLSRKVRVVATAPEASHSPIVYPIAVLKRSSHSAAAEAFIHFLMGPQARQAFERDGFVMPGP